MPNAQISTGFIRVDVAPHHRLVLTTGRLQEFRRRLKHVFCRHRWGNQRMDRVAFLTDQIGDVVAAMKPLNSLVNPSLLARSHCFPARVNSRQASLGLVSGGDVPLRITGVSFF